MDVAVYGAGKCGQYVLEEINSDKNNLVRCKLFIDNSVEYSGKTKEGIPVISVERFLEEKRAETVLIAVSHPHVAQEMVLSLLRGGFDNIYMMPENMLDGKFPVLNGEGEFMAYIQKYDNLRPILPYVEYHVSDFCNLNCRGCGHFSNIVLSKEFPSIEAFKRALEGMSRKFENIGMFRLMGGEPLINPELDLYVRAVRRYFPYTYISVVTNGLLLPRIREKVAEAIRECGAVVDITQYPPTRQLLEEIMEVAQKKQIKIWIGKPVTEFFHKMSVDVNDNYELAWEKCISKTCYFLRDGHLYPCPLAGLLYENRKFFELDITKEMQERSGFDMVEGKESGWKVMEALTQPNQFCKYCHTDSKSVAWEISGRDIKKEDWMVKMNES